MGCTRIDGLEQLLRGGISGVSIYHSKCVSVLRSAIDNNLLKCFARCCVQRQYYCRPFSLVRMESWQIFYRLRHRGKQHLALRGVGATLRAGGQTRSFLNPLLMFFRSMVCLSHEPYYFSTRWNTNGPNIPSFHCSIIPIVSEAN
jgi:hypothetical protein